MDSEKPASGKTQRVPRSWVAAGILIILAVPLVIVFLSMKGCACAPVPADAAPAVRTGPDSIRITMQPDASFHHNRLPFLSIIVNERDASNQSAIAAAQLPLVISPPGGLEYREGSSVILSGDGVAGNASAPVHLWIVATYPDNGYVTVIGDVYR